MLIIKTDLQTKELRLSMGKRGNRLPMHKRNSALFSLLLDYFGNSENVSDTHSILYYTAIGVCKVAGVKFIVQITTRPKNIVTAWQYRTSYF